MYFNNSGPGWQQNVAGQMSQPKAEFGSDEAKPSTRVHHAPGGFSQFSIRHQEHEQWQPSQP
jgi:hypothetical protein